MTENTQIDCKFKRKDGESLDIVANNIKVLSTLFPDAVKEGKVDFTLLKEELGEYLDDKQESFSFSWNGKAKAKRYAQSPTLETLRPDRDGSVNFDTTENMIIEGDNLEVLKILQKSYYKKIKMIYIDPPYNTGSDFLYTDDFSDSRKAYEEQTGLLNDEGKSKTGKNLKDSGQFHTKWLNFMYPRLYLAKTLLKDDGVIFISIDDNEAHNLRQLCNLIFSDKNVDTMIWRKSGVGRDGKMKNTSTFRKDHEYLLVCFRREQTLSKSFEKPNWENDYGNPDNDSRGNYKSGVISKKEEASNPNHKNYYMVTSPGGRCITRQFDCDKEEFERLNNDNRIYWGKDGNSIPSIKIFEDEKREVTTSSIIDYKDMTTTLGSKEIEDLFNINGLGEEMRPKPVNLIKKILSIGSKADDIILDFFAGSGTTGQAVMELNKEDGGNRKFLLVQLPEVIDEKTTAFKNGYKTIFEITADRNRKVIEKIKKEIIEETSKAGLLAEATADKYANIDLGFKVFRQDSSNLKIWDASWDNIENALLSGVDNIKQKRSEDDLLYEFLLKKGLPLTTPLNKRDVLGKKVFESGDFALSICFEKDLNMEFIKALSAKIKENGIYEPTLIFKDQSFESNVVKTNAIQYLRQVHVNEKGKPLISIETI